MAIIYTPAIDDDNECWTTRYNNGNVSISLVIANVDNVLNEFIAYFIDDRRIFVICTFGGITELIDIKKSSEIFDIKFTQSEYQTSVMNSKFINKIKEFMCLFDLSEAPMFREVFAEFIDPIIKSATY
jgi:hypothetical protein